MRNLQYKTILFYSLFTIFNSSFSQEKNKFNVNGKVAENDIIALEDVSVIVYEDFDKIAEQKTSTSGNFSFALDMNKRYTLEFSKPLYVTKKIELNTEVPEKCKKKKTFDYVDLPVISLFKIVEGVNYKLYKKPYMYFQYSEKCKFERDEHLYLLTLPHIQNLEKEVNARKKEIANLSKEEEEAKKEEAKAIYEEYKKEIIKEQEKEKFKTLPSSEKYKELIKQADAFFNSGNYESAKKKYMEALNLKAGDLYAEMQLMKLDPLIAEQQKKKHKQTDDLALKQKEISKEERLAAKSVETKKEEKKTEALLLKLSDDSAVKAANAQMEKQREIERINDMKSILAHAHAKRIFLEEIADSKMKMKKNNLNPDSHVQMINVN